MVVILPYFLFDKKKRMINIILFVLIIFLIGIILSMPVALINEEPKDAMLFVVIPILIISAAISLPLIMIGFFSNKVYEIFRLYKVSKKRELIYKLENNIFEEAKEAWDRGDQYIDHLINKTSISNYFRMIEKIFSCLKEEHLSGKILDWGCGYGQMVYILKKFSFDVVGYDVKERKEMYYMPMYAELRKNGAIQIGDRFNLPYANNEFDAILAIGTWDEIKKDELDPTIIELKRILRKNGILFAFNLPNENYYIDSINRFLKRELKGRRFNKDYMVSLFRSKNFKICSNSFNNMLPKVLIGFSKLFKNLFGFGGMALVKFDYFFLSKIPFFKKFSGMFELILQDQD